jgi:hypothetical protein
VVVTSFTLLTSTLLSFTPFFFFFFFFLALVALAVVYFLSFHSFLDPPMDPSTAVSWHIPHISISPAPPEEAAIEPYSPFSSTPVTSSDEDAYRPRHLTPPPTLPTFGQVLRPLEDTCNPEVLGRERFEALLQASAARHAPISANKAGDLRKEIASKAHTNTQGMINPFPLVCGPYQILPWQRVGVPFFSPESLRPHLQQRL